MNSRNSRTGRNAVESRKPAKSAKPTRREAASPAKTTESTPRQTRMLDRALLTALILLVPAVGALWVMILGHGQVALYIAAVGLILSAINICLGLPFMKDHVAAISLNRSTRILVVLAMIIAIGVGILGGYRALTRKVGAAPTPHLYVDGLPFYGKSLQIHAPNSSSTNYTNEVFSGVIHNETGARIDLVEFKMQAGSLSYKLEHYQSAVCAGRPVDIENAGNQNVVFVLSVSNETATQLDNTHALTTIIAVDSTGHEWPLVSRLVTWPEFNSLHGYVDRVTVECLLLRHEN